jgi:GT2 family glycosyltransferase
LRPVTVVILAWNHWSLTRTLLDSIARTTDTASATFLVVDNGSTDETPRELARYPWVSVVRNEENLGFVRGNNAGIRAADATHDVLLLNNDVEVLERGWLERLREAAHADERNGIVGCRLVLGDGRLLHAGTFIRPDDCWGQQIGSLELDLNQYAETRVVEGIVFACAYLKREVLDDVGLLSEAFTTFFEDTDYCLRAAERGWRTLCCGSVTLRHDEHGSFAGDDAKRLAMFERARTTFRDLWGARLAGRYTSSVHWQSTLNAATGYAMSSREIVRALDEAGVRLTYEYAYGKGTPLPFDEQAAAGDPVIDLIRARRVPKRPEIAVTYAQGDVFERNHGRRRIGFTMLEVDGFPADWVRQANAMDEVWTPTEFNRRGLLDSGVKRPVHVVPLGIDPHHFHPGVRRVPNRRGDYVFVTNLEWGERKDPERMLRTFNGTFRSAEPVLLVCKVNNRSPLLDVPNEIRSLGLNPRGGRIFFLYNRELPHYQLATFYRSADCFVNTSRGEGWGLPLLEAMACGLPAIASDWGGHTAILDPDDTYPLRVRELIPAVSQCRYYDGMRWADADMDHFSALLRHVFEHQDEARAKGLRAAERVRRTLTWQHTAAVIAGRLRA